MAEESQIKNDLKQYIDLDNTEREHKEKIREIKKQKDELSKKILAFMKENSVDNFALEGNGSGLISRSVRTSRPPLKRNLIKTQLLLQFSDQPQRVAEVLRAIEGVPDNAEDMSVGGTQRELLVRRLPRNKS